jgi:hypothetical protein
MNTRPAETMRFFTIRRGSASLESRPIRYRDRPDVITYIHLEYARLLEFDTIRDFLKSIASYTCCHDSKEFFEAQQAIDRAMMEALWRSNQLDVQNFRLPDIGEINLRLNGIASRYLKKREFLRKEATKQ